MTGRRVQILFFGFVLYFFAPSVQGDPVVGRNYPFSIIDVDGNKVSAADGQITTVVVTSSSDIARAREVGDRTPDYCLGNPRFRMITLLRFKRKHMAATRAILKAAVRRHLSSESHLLQARYRAKNIQRDARHDVICVADFDETAGAQLGIPNGWTSFQVFVLGRGGELLRMWDQIPTAEELAEVLK